MTSKTLIFEDDDYFHENIDTQENDYKSFSDAHHKIEDNFVGCINLNENFDEYIKSYDITKNDINTNTKVFYLLTMKLKKELQEHYINYMSSMSDDEELNKNLTKKQINKSALNYINSKYKELIKTKNYNLITKIQKKYNIKQQDELVFNYC